VQGHHGINPPRTWPPAGPEARPRRRERQRWQRWQPRTLMRSLAVEVDGDTARGVQRAADVTREQPRLARSRLQLVELSDPAVCGLVDFQGIRGIYSSPLVVPIAVRTTEFTWCVHLRLWMEAGAGACQMLIMASCPAQRTFISYRGLESHLAPWWESNQETSRAKIFRTTETSKREHQLLSTGPELGSQRSRAPAFPPTVAHGSSKCPIGAFREDT
jgi:hypothetical protein